MEISKPCGYNTLVTFNKLRVNCWLSFCLPALLPSRYARPLITQHFAVCTLLMGCQGSARECHGAVCHRAVTVEAGDNDVQVSFPAHLSLLCWSSRSWQPPHDSFWIFSPHAADRHKWGGFRVLEVSPLGLEDGVQPFCATVMQFPTTEQNPTEQLLVPEILPKPAVDISVLISAVNKQRKVSLDLCHCLKEQNWLKKEVKLLPYDQVARHCLGFARLFLLG